VRHSCQLSRGKRCILFHSVYPDTPRHTLKTAWFLANVAERQRAQLRQPHLTLLHRTLASARARLARQAAISTLEAPAVDTARQRRPKL
jgi:hypothetical protein